MEDWLIILVVIMVAVFVIYPFIKDYFQNRNRYNY
ncbi:MAG: FeoB-associated Cys-rich membrane protein [Ignavibacteriales bacterium]|nr:FeoB-associated Cys-rich membrane protein [Ignavibacteriales bacterium]